MLSINWLILSVLMRVHRRSLLPCQGKWRGVPCTMYGVPCTKHQIVAWRQWFLTACVLWHFITSSNCSSPRISNVDQRIREWSESARMKFQKGLGSWLHFPWNSVSYRYSIINPQNVSFSKTTRPSLSNVNQADGTDGKKDTSRFTMPVRAPIIYFFRSEHTDIDKKTRNGSSMLTYR